MSKYLLSIISEQALPTLHFIKQFGEPDSFFLFVSTVEMEENNATQHIMQALKLPIRQCKTIIIDANDAAQAKDNLMKAKLPIVGKYLVNLTGGNKLMSQMVFQHLQSYDSAMYYAPIQSDRYQQLYPEIISIPKDPEIKISLVQYLHSYGYEITGDMPYYKGTPKPTSLFKKVIDAGGAANVPEIKRSISPDYKENDKGYLSGDWFEFYCYQFFKRIFCLSESQIGCSVGLKKIGSSTINEHDNEFDLMFIFQNDLYVFECKVYSSKNYNKEKYQIPMYKLASLTHQFGLKCKKFLAVLAELPESPENLTQLEQLRSNLGIDKLISIEDFKNYIDRDILVSKESSKLNFKEKLELLQMKFNQ